MLYVSLRNGTTTSFDLGDPDGFRAWEILASDPSGLTGLALSADGYRADLPLPRRFRELRFSAEVLRGADGVATAERILAVADGVVLSLTMRLNGRVGRFRVDLDKRGKARWVPPS